MWYIYELSYNSIPFYVGISTDPKSRYYGHITSPLSRCYSLIRFCIYHFETYPDINIVSNWGRRAKALEMERARINELISDGIALVNMIHISLDPIVLPKWRIVPPHIYKTLKDQIEKYEHQKG